MNNSNSDNFLIRDVLSDVVKKIESGEARVSKLDQIWEEIVSKIYNYGQRLAEHSKIVQIKNNIALIETDHSGWNMILQNNKNFIVKGLNMHLPGLEIRNLAFRVRGSEAVIAEKFEDYKNREKEKFLNQDLENQKKLEEMGLGYKPGNREVPEDVKNLIAGLLHS